MAAMDRLCRACHQYYTYPHNLIMQHIFPHHLETFSAMLDKKEGVLFGPEDGAVLHFLDYGQDEYGCRTRICTVEQLLDHLGVYLRPYNLTKKDPQTRFVFITAPTARSKLNITREMLTLLLSFHQTMAPYLNLLFTFGERKLNQDFKVNTLYAETHLRENEKGIEIEAVGRSGRSLQICYTLRSVEQYTVGSETRWSIRPCATYHSFDITNGRSTWIITKGNLLLRERIEKLKGGSTSVNNGTSEGVKASLASALEIHLLFCDWAVENWRWYIDGLEEDIQNDTQTFLFNPVNPIQYLAPEQGHDSTNYPQVFDANSTNSLFNRMKAMVFDVGRRMGRLPRKDDVERYDSAAETGHRLGGYPSSSPMPEESDNYLPRFDDLQNVQAIEDKANEADLVLAANADIFVELGVYYRELPVSDLDENHDLLHSSIDKFERRIKFFEDDLRKQISRLKNLSKFIADRKALCYGALDYRSMLANRTFGTKAQRSAEKMEEMTRNMQSVASETQSETVSMRIITLVTLFYLPGTFVSAMMSTNMVKELGQTASIHLFVELTLPLMVATFIAWGWFYRCAERSGKTRSATFRTS